MFRTRTSSSFLLVLVAVPAFAEERVVTDFTDDPRAPAPGSFRAVLATAQPGDVVVFEHPLVIPLAADLNVDRPGVTVRGRAGFQRASSVRGRRLPVLRVRAEGVSLEDLDLRDVLVAAEPASARGRLAGFALRDCDFQGSGGLAMERCDGALVSGVTMSLDNTGGRSRSRIPAILDLGGVGTRIESAQITNVRGQGLSAVEVTGLVVQGGRIGLDAAISPGLARRSAPGDWQPGEVRVDGVDFGEGRLEIVRARSRPEGPVRVSDCTAGRMRVSAAAAEVTGNTVGLPEDDPLYAVGNVLTVTNANLPGAMRVEDNVVTGGGLGIEVFHSRGRAACTVAGNTVTDAANVGISAYVGDRGLLLRNTVTGGLTLGVKIGIAVSGAGTSVEVRENTVHDTGGQGIRVLQDEPGVVLRDNTLRDNAGAGIYVQTKARADVVGGTVERCGAGGDSFLGGNSGIVFAGRTVGSVEGTTLRGNAGPGVYVWKSGAVRLSRLACSGNGGPGIDVERNGVGFLWSKRTAPDWPLDLAFDESARAVTGKAFAGALVQVYRVEEEPWTGNDGYGEGAAFLAEGTAASDGTFSVPVQCVTGDLLTATVTRTGDRAATSEFTANVECRGAAIEVVSVSSEGEPGDDRSGSNLRAGYGTRPAVGGGGRWVVFESDASNLAPGVYGANDLHVFLRDTQTGVTTRVTRSPAGDVTPDVPGTNGLVGVTPSISEDGRWIAYCTTSEEIIPGAAGGNYPYTVLFDAQEGTIVAVSDPIPRAPEDPFPSGQFTNYGGDDACISGDGSVVAFVSIGRDWVPGLADRGFDRDLFVWTRATGAVEWVSVPTSGADVPSSTFFGPESPRFSHDGRYVAFATNQDLTGTGGAPSGAVYVRDRTAGTTEAVSLDSSGSPRDADTPQISSDGRWVAFTSALALVPSDTNGREDVYLRDREAGTTDRVSVRADGSDFPARCSVPAMSADGRFIAFETVGQYVVPDGPTVLNVVEIWLVDRVEETVREVSGGENGEAFGSSYAPVLSRDGKALLFQSFASNLVPSVTGDTYRLQAYLRRL